MTDTVLTSERILETAEDVLRRSGPAKATVVDVARAVGVSHGSVYRHFPSKGALRDAVAERWLARISEPLEAVARDDGPALDRLRRWLELLIASKRSRALEDPELFATYVQLVAESRDVVVAHVKALTDQLAAIIALGVQRGEFADVDPAMAVAPSSMRLRASTTRSMRRSGPTPGSLRRSRAYGRSSSPRFVQSRQRGAGQALAGDRS